MQAVVWHRLDPEALDEVFDLDVPQKSFYSVSDEELLASDIVARVLSCRELGQRFLRWGAENAIVDDDIGKVYSDPIEQGEWYDDWTASTNWSCEFARLIVGKADNLWVVVLFM